MTSINTGELKFKFKYFHYLKCTFFSVYRCTINEENTRERIQETARRFRKAISAEIKGKLICIKVDSCSKGVRKFFAINLQFIDKKRIQLRVLAVREMLVSETGHNLRLVIEDVLWEYSIPVECIYTLTSDNGGNMICAAQLLGQSQDEVAAELYFPPDNTDTLDCGCVLGSGDFKVKSVRCAADTLQLAVDGGRKDIPATEIIIEKIRELAKSLRTPNGWKQLTNNGLTIPCLDVSTRWHTIHDMLQSVRNLREFLEEKYVGNACELLTNEEWDELHSVLASLGPAKIATKRLQEEQLLLGDFLAVWMNCKDALKKTGTPLANAIVRRMDEQAKGTTYKRGPNKGEELRSSLLESPIFLAAICMDPRYFNYLDETQVATAKTHLVKLWSRMEAIKKRQENLKEDEHHQTAESMDGAASEENDGNSSSDDEFTKFLKKKDEKRTQDVSLKSEIVKILDSYYAETKRLSRKADVLEYWWDQRKISPELYELSCVALAVPATQVSVERLFSSLRFILNPLRQNLQSTFVEDMLVIRNNTIFMSKTHESTSKKPRKHSSASNSSNTVSLEQQNSSSISLNSVSTSSNVTPTSPTNFDFEDIL